MNNTGGKKKRGEITSVDLGISVSITSDTGMDFIAYVNPGFPVGTTVEFTDTEQKDPITGKWIATNVEPVVVNV